MAMKLYLLFLLVLSASSQEESEGQCVWYGTCGTNPLTKQTSNCPYDGPPKPLDQMSTALLTAACPELVQDIVSSNGTLRTCCSPEQITSLMGQMAMAGGMLARCPTCISNFRLTFCYMTCAPDQAKYMKVKSTAEVVVNHKPARVITDLQFTMSNTYAEKVFDSCKDVSMPSANAKAMSVMCGQWGSFYCSPHRWFDFMGDTKSNPLTPFQIDYVYVPSDNDTVTMFDHEVVPCSDQVNSDSSSCSCMDCQSACPVPPPPPPPSDMNGKLQILLFTLGILGTLMALLVLSCCACNKDNDPSDPDAIPRTCFTFTSCKKLGLRISAGIEFFFVKWGTLVASHPVKMIVLSVGLAIALSCGILKLEVTTDPVELWASSNSLSRQHKEYFDEHFGPFYRTEMLIIRPVGVEPFEQNTPNGVKMWGPAFNKEFLKAVLDLQNYIELEIRGDDNTTLADICFKPLSPNNDNCTIQSALNYFQNEPGNLDKESVNGMGFNVTYLDHLDACFRNPISTSDAVYDGLPCLGQYGGPVFPYTATGGFLENNSTDLGDNPAYSNATALVVTFVVNNHLNKSDNAGAVAWEKAFLDYMKNYSHPLLDIAYSAERAVQDEIERVSHGDVSTVLISYLLMFVYIVCSIGQVNGCQRLLVDSKVTLGLCGVLIVLVSVTAAVGFYGLIGVPATLIIIEVIPFLVLAVGVDNMFLIVRSIQTAEKQPTETPQQMFGRVMGEVAPSLLISTGSEAACFFLGALSQMPAVRAFALYAGLALTIDFLLQISCFLAVMYLDHCRQESNRIDILCCVKSKSTAPLEKREGFLTIFMRDYYGKLLTKPTVKVLVLTLFGLWFMSSVPFMHEVEIGLDQELSMPEDSFLLKYFSYLGQYLSVGPPVYFVLTPGVNFSSGLAEQNKICATVDCDKNSLVLQLYSASKIANRSYIARPASSWIDDYIDWSLYNLGSDYPAPCCRVHENGTFCPSDDESEDCNACDIEAIDHKMRPSADSFNKYLPFFLEDNPSESCPKAGHAAYGSAVNILGNDTDMSVGASHFMTYHTILKTSKDYYSALSSARDIASTISKDIQSSSNDSTTEVFPYSVFYVYYEQYLSIMQESVWSVFVSIATVFVVMFIVSGFDLHSSLIVALGLVILLVNMAGCMYWFNVTLNAVSLVNIIMSVGIFVEFLSHIVFAYARADHPDPDQRMLIALSHTGSSVLSGITLTKIVGVSVLAFAKSQIFRIFYFRMYVFIIVLGAAHGLLWMPVLLSVIGPAVPAHDSSSSSFSRLLNNFTSDLADIENSEPNVAERDNSDETVASGGETTAYGAINSDASG